MDSSRILARRRLRRGWARFAGLLSATLVTCGCVSGDDIPRIDDEDPLPPVPDAFRPPAADAGPESDGEPGDGGLKPFRARCTENAECADGWCVTNNDVDICTRRCLRGGCPEGWNCLVVSNTVPDAVSVCVPPDGRLCRPCEASGDCPEGACHEMDGEPVCGVACDPEADEDDNPCPPGYVCGEVDSLEGERSTQCVPTTASCACNANTENPGAVRFCERTNAAGSCRGRQTCDPAQGWSACPAQTPAAEVCDGLDNDCNGFADDVAGLDEPCEVSAEVGGDLRTCAGFRICGREGGEPVCSAPTPSAERCNRRDDDCDGRTDEGFGLDEICTVGAGACERSGIRACTEDGSDWKCSVAPGPMVDELCNGVDDDCDGSTDEAFPTLAQPCAVGVGACRRAGLEVCAEDGSAAVCSAAPGGAADEVCNGVDDDCDGTADEGFDGLRSPCTDGVGLCARQGISVCAADGAGVTCDAVAGAPAAEVCDRLDNDCDGVTDEGFADLGRICAAGMGACMRQGVRVCAADGAAVVCNAEAGAPGEEVCNGVDDDCDGAADETYPERNRPCEVGVGACRQNGIRVCGDDQRSLRCDAVAGAPAVEVCNGVDDDCDGTADEPWPTLGRGCELGRGLCRRAGTWVCDPGDADGVSCDAERVPPNPEDRCDYQDDDCDGRADEDHVDASGRYSTLAHCGACGTDCAGLWDPAPEAFGVVPRCAVVGNGAQCAFDCVPGRRDADGVPNNGCELVVDEDAIYVSTPANGGVDGPDCGGLDAPCATIGGGLDRAEAAGRSRVRVSEGVYRESVTLRAGVDLLGGHQRLTWQRAPDLNVTIINGRTPQGELHRWVVRAEGIDAPTVFDGFALNGESPLLEGNAYGVFVLDSTAALRISDNRIFGGDGGRGRDGAAGNSGAPGRPGADGAASTRAVPVGEPSPCAEGTAGVPGTPIDPADPEEGLVPGQLGGAGGQRTCGDVSVDGGAGGYTSCPTINRQEGSGEAGEGPQPGAGGDAGWGLLSLAEMRCEPSDEAFGPADPDSGGNGRRGEDGVGGAGAAADGGLLGGHWRGDDGGAGVDGAPGSGGGGGGGAGGTLVLWPRPEAADFGATGGGGGSGGCAGAAGRGGTAGGGAFGIFVTYSDGAPGPGGFPTITGNRIARGLGGNGGAGGNGGGGGEGGVGGGGGGRGDVWMGFCSFAGGEGGQGGRGGHGGGGGGGQGGPSYDIFVVGGEPPDYAALNAFELAEGVPTFGVGGRGGNSSNTDLGAGGDGADGASGNVGVGM